MATADLKGSDRNLIVQTLKIFWRHALAYWPLLLVCGAGVLVTIACDMISPLIFRQLFNQLAIDPFHKAPRAQLGEIYHTIFLIAIVNFVSWFGARSFILALQKVECRTMKNLTDYCFAYLQQHSHRFFTDNFGGALVKRVNRFASGFEMIADQCSFNIGQTTIRVICIVGILFWRNTMLGLVFLAWAVLFIGFNIVFAKWKLKYDLARAEMDTKVTQRLADTITNATNLKLFAGTDREISAFQEITSKHRDARYRSWNLAWKSEAIQGLSIRALEVIVLVMAVAYWAVGILSIGDFVLLRSYLSQLTENVRQMGQDIRKIYESMADANEMTEILITPHEVRDVEGAATLTVPTGTIEFRNVNFIYPNAERPVLENFNLSIGAGERVGIVGHTGGGKSTILKLLERLHDVNGGEILVDHQDIAHVTQRSLHQNVAYVPQDPVLFHRSLLENIRYGRPDASDDEVIRAAKRAHCHEFISNFAAGYMTLVGERGVKLSGGERQRVAIARAMLMNAPILVLDEATSSLDSESETYIQDSLSQLFADRTVIAVAHRLSTIRRMDRIVVVKDGAVIEQGSHDILLRVENGTYRKLWGLQSANLLDDEGRSKYLQ